MFQRIAYYVAAAVVEGTRKSVSGNISRLLDTLVARVVEYVGWGPVQMIRRSDGDRQSTQLLAARVEGATRRNPALQAELRRLAAEIDRAGGRSMIRGIFGDVNLDTPPGVVDTNGNTPIQAFFGHAWNTNHVTSGIAALVGIGVLIAGLIIAMLTDRVADLVPLLVVGVSLAAIGAVWNRFTMP